MSTVYEHGVIDSGEAKTHALISYILLAVGLFTAIPILFGGVWAMIKRSSARGTIYHSHYTNAIRTFWWTIFWTVVGCILVFVAIGWLILGAAWLWALYRVVNGFAKITSDEAYPL